VPASRPVSPKAPLRSSTCTRRKLTPSTADRCAASPSLRPLHNVKNLASACIDAAFPQFNTTRSSTGTFAAPPRRLEHQIHCPGAIMGARRGRYRFPFRQRNGRSARLSGGPLEAALNFRPDIGLPLSSRRLHLQASHRHPDRAGYARRPSSFGRSDRGQQRSLARRKAGAVGAIGTSVPGNVWIASLIMIMLTPITTPRTPAA